MKKPKETNRYCDTCKKHTKQKIGTAKQSSRSASHPMSRGSTSRQEARGERGRPGNQGRYSKPAPKAWKRKTKTTRRISITYKCSECGKIKGIKKAVRTGRIEIGEKVAK